MAAFEKNFFSRTVEKFLAVNEGGIVNRKACEAQVVVCILFAFYLVDVLPDVLRLLFLF